MELLEERWRMSTILKASNKTEKMVALAERMTKELVSCVSRSEG